MFLRFEASKKQMFLELFVGGIFFNDLKSDFLEFVSYNERGQMQ